MSVLLISCGNRSLQVIRRATNRAGQAAGWTHRAHWLWSDSVLHSRSQRERADMRRLIMAMLTLSVLAACQGASDHDPPVVDESECQQRQLDAGTCGRE